MHPEERSIRVEFHRGIDPRLVPAGEAEVACHLYDREAMEAADDLRRGASG